MALTIGILEIGILEISDIDKDGDFRIEIDNEVGLNYKYIDKKEAQEIIDFLTEQLNKP